MAKYPSQLQDKFNLRFPDGMRDAIADAARKSGRSMNSEIIYRIQRSFELDDIDAGFQPTGLRKEIEIRPDRIEMLDENNKLHPLTKEYSKKYLELFSPDKLEQTSEIIRLALEYIKNNGIFEKPSSNDEEEKK